MMTAEANAVEVQPVDLPALPRDADANCPGDEGWTTDYGVTSRLVWSRPMPLPERLDDYNLRAVVTQLADGTVYHDREAVFVDGRGYTLDEARSIAAAIAKAVALVDEWCGQERGNTIVVHDGVDKFEVLCEPFEPDDPEYDGDRMLAILHCGDEEGSVILTGAQATELAGLLAGGTGAAAVTR